jgi:hypothetical protein
LGGGDLGHGSVSESCYQGAALEWIQSSIRMVHDDSAWANIFNRVTFAGYLPSLIT